MEITWYYFICFVRIFYLEEWFLENNDGPRQPHCRIYTTCREDKPPLDYRFPRFAYHSRSTCPIHVRGIVHQDWKDRHTCSIAMKLESLKEFERSQRRYLIQGGLNFIYSTFKAFRFQYFLLLWTLFQSRVSQYNKPIWQYFISISVWSNSFLCSCCQNIKSVLFHNLVSSCWINFNRLL